MKKFYNSEEGSPLQSDWGEFPSFWQDLKKWPHMRIMRKIYLSVSDMRESGDKDPIDVLVLKKRAEGSDASPGSSSQADRNGHMEATDDAQGKEATELPRKRRKKSRWASESSPKELASQGAVAGGSSSGGDAISAPDSGAVGSEEQQSGHAHVHDGAEGAGCAGEGGDFRTGGEQERQECEGVAAMTERGRRRERPSRFWSAKDVISTGRCGTSPSPMGLH